MATDDTRTPLQRASDALMDRWHRDAGLVAAVDRDGATWWVRPASAAAAAQHSLAGMRARLSSAD